jgi:exodeoxyribonuclease III
MTPWPSGFTIRPDPLGHRLIKGEAQFDIPALYGPHTTREVGYGAAWRGQKSWIGVAILAKDADPIVTRTELPGDPSGAQSRYIEAAVKGVLAASIYLPNGNPQPGPKFDYKLAWFERLGAHAATLMAAAAPVVLAGDFNVAPTDLDIYPTLAVGATDMRRGMNSLSLQVQEALRRDD